MNLEQSMLKVIQESIVQAFKTHKKFIEKETTISINKVTMLKKQGKKSGEVLDGFNEQIRRLETLREKYLTLIDEEEELFKNLEARVAHLAKLEPTEDREADKEAYFEKRLKRIILDYMLR